MMNITDITTPDFMNSANLDALVDTLTETMIELGKELTDENGGREDWLELVLLASDAIDEDDHGLEVTHAHKFICRVSYLIAVADLKSK